MTLSLSVLFFPRLLLCLIEDHVQVCFASKSRHLYPPVPLSLCIEEKFTSQTGDIGNCIWIRFVPKFCPCNWKHKYHHDHYKPLMASKYLFALVTSDCLPLSALALIPVVNNTACQILQEILFFVYVFWRGHLSLIAPLIIFFSRAFTAPSNKNTWRLKLQNPTKVIRWNGMLNFFSTLKKSH